MSPIPALLKNEIHCFNVTPPFSLPVKYKGIESYIANLSKSAIVLPLLSDEGEALAKVGGESPKGFIFSVFWYILVKKG